jgi:hypothetical protein
MACRLALGHYSSKSLGLLDSLLQQNPGVKVVAVLDSGAIRSAPSRSVVGGWWLVVGGWWLVVGGWWQGTWPAQLTMTPVACSVTLSTQPSGARTVGARREVTPGRTGRWNWPVVRLREEFGSSIERLSGSKTLKRLRVPLLRPCGGFGVGGVEVPSHPDQSVAEDGVSGPRPGVRCVKGVQGAPHLPLYTAAFSSLSAGRWAIARW